MVFENYPSDNAALTETIDGLQIAGIQIRDSAHYPLSLIMAPGEQIYLRLDYDLAHFERAAAEAIGTRLVRLLETAAAALEMPAHRLDILSSEERNRILKEFNDTRRPLPEERCRSGLKRKLLGRQTRKPQSLERTRSAIMNSTPEPIRSRAICVLAELSLVLVSACAWSVRQEC